MLVPTVKAIFISFLLNYLSSFVCFAYHTCTSPFSVPTRKSWNYCALFSFSWHWLWRRQGVIYHRILIWLLSTEQRVSAKGRSIYYLGPVSTRTIIPSCSCPQGPTEILVLAVFSRWCPVTPCSHCNTKRPEDSVTHTRAHTLPNTRQDLIINIKTRAYMRTPVIVFDVALQCFSIELGFCSSSPSPLCPNLWPTSNYTDRVYLTCGLWSCQEVRLSISKDR